MYNFGIKKNQGSHSGRTLFYNLDHPKPVPGRNGRGVAVVEHFVFIGHLVARDRGGIEMEHLGVDRVDITVVAGAPLDEGGGFCIR